MTARYDYTDWDGTQQWGDLDPDDLLAELTDDLLSGGDLNDALRRLMRSGMRTRDGERIMGMREMIERTRKRREELLKQGSPNAEMERIAKALDEVVDQERAAIDALEQEAKDSGDERRAEVTSDVATERRMSLDLLPQDLAGKVQGLQHHDFVSSEARERFEELMEELREQVAQTYFEGMSEALSSADPEQLARIRAAMDALNTMLEQRARGEELDPTFEQFMENYGDMFPGNPSTLDELLEQLAERMAAAEAMWRSMSPEQREQLQSLANSLLEDMDLRWQMERLAGNLRQAVPGAGWGQSYRFHGQSPMGFGDATDAASQLGDLDRMEELFASASSPNALDEVDIDQVRRQLGEDSGSFARAAGPSEQDPRRERPDRAEGWANRAHAQGGPQARPTRAERPVLPDAAGTDRRSPGGDLRWRARPRGDHQALRVRRPAQPPPLGDRPQRGATGRFGGAGPIEGRGLRGRRDRGPHPVGHRTSGRPLHVDADAGQLRSGQEDGDGTSRRSSRHVSRDYLGIVGFSEVAREIKAEDLPTAMWDYVYGTNLQHALALARRMLAHQYGTKQIIVVTDGEPTAHIDDAGEVWFNYPPVQETLQRTMAEVIRTTRAGITINTFALDLERTHYPFVEQIARVNGGRTFYTTPDALGGYVLVDFLRHRRYLRPAG